MTERRAGMSRLHGRPLDENGRIELTVERSSALTPEEQAAITELAELFDTFGTGRTRVLRKDAANFLRVRATCERLAQENARLKSDEYLQMCEFDAAQRTHKALALARELARALKDADFIINDSIATATAMAAKKGVVIPLPPAGPKTAAREALLARPEVQTLLKD